MTRPVPSVDGHHAERVEPAGDSGGPHAGPGSAVLWSFVNTAAGRFGTLAIGIALARLLGPTEFGTFAIALVALMAILSFNELGVSLAIVRWSDEPEQIAPTVNSISVGMSLVLTCAMVLAAPSFANAMGDPGAAVLVQLLSLCVLINGVVATPAAILQRNFRQDQRLWADQVNVWVGAGLSIGLAVAGVGAAALVIGRLVGSALSAVLLLYFAPVPYRFGWAPPQAKRLLAFGVPLAGSSIIVFLIGFLDQLVVGHRLGPAELGAYVLAANLAGWPVSLFSGPLRSVAPPLFAGMRHRQEDVAPMVRAVLRLLLAVSLPVCFVLAAASPELVDVVYGSRWSAAAPVLAVLAVLAAARIFFEYAYDLLVVLGRSSGILHLQLVLVATLAPALVCGVALGGTKGAALASLAVSLLVSLPLYVAQLRSAGIRVADLARSAVVPLLLSGSAGGATALARAADLAPWMVIVLGGASGLVVMLLMLLTFRSDISLVRGGRNS